MNQSKFTTLTLSLAFAMMVFLVGCGEDAPPPVPTLTFIAEVDGYDVTITVESEFADTYSWDYGNGATSTNSSGHTYTYPESGDYTITVTAEGAGGSVTKTASVSIAASLSELLAGVDAGGKTWLLNSTASTAITAVNPAFDPVYQAVPTDGLGAFGLSEEYDNEFTFAPDGTYTIKTINGSVLMGTVFLSVNELVDQVTIGAASLVAAGMGGVSFADVTDGTWTLNEDTDLTLKSLNNEFRASDNDPIVGTDVTFEGADYLSFSAGSFFAIRDFTTEILIKNLTADEMEIVMFLSTHPSPGTDNLFTNPSLAVTTKYKAK